MEIIKNLIKVLLSILLFAIGCSKSTPNRSLAKELSLIKIEDALNDPNLAFVNLINKVRGSVGTNSYGSKVIWSRKNNYNLGLFVSANHIYGIKTWPSLKEEFIDITEINNGIFLGSKIPQTNGNIGFTNELIANFGFYHPNITANATNTSIHPKDDFYLGIIDNQRILDNGLGNYPGLVQTSTPLQMYDPNNRTQANQTWAAVKAKEIVIAVGYPQDKIKYLNGAVSSGKVYSDTEAKSILQSLLLNGDPEGGIPYNPEVEFLANISAITGMSGGGVFNIDGQLLGIMVRATELNDEPVLRVVRITYIRQKINTFYNSLSIADKHKIRPFIGGELN